jgi:Lon protease-like protein
MNASPSTGPGGDLGSIKIPGIIPIFPLPNLVFYPRTYLPLHIFEPRYQEMVRDAAATHRMIGMVLLKDGWETDYEGAPAIFPTGCVGRMISVQPLPDGRSNIMLQGLRRFEVQQEVGAESYRQAHIQLQNLQHPDSELPPDLRAELRKMVGNFFRFSPDGAALSEMLKQPLRDDVLVQNLSFALEFTPVEKQFLLESETLVQQTRRLLDLLQFKLYERNDHIGWG